MKLSTEDVDLFYKLMWRLQLYVSRKRQMLSKIASVEGYGALPMADKIPVRDSLWENPELIDAFIRENPDGLSSEDLEIVRRWKRFVAGTFQIFRFLKNHTIFIGEKDRVYGVLALQDSLEDLFWGRKPPVMVKTVLLPFKGKIIYDGVLTGYNVLFGGGIRSGLNDVYLAAKQNDRIITTLEPELARPTQPATQVNKDWRPEVDEIVARTERLKGGPAIQSSAFNLLRASATLAQAAVGNADDLEELWKLERRVRTALSRLQTVLGRAE
jgi:hypothetical protein